jgi:hypothetical protein
MNTQAARAQRILDLKYERLLGEWEEKSAEIAQLTQEMESCFHIIFPWELSTSSSSSSSSMSSSSSSPSLALPVSQSFTTALEVNDDFSDEEDEEEEETAPVVPLQSSTEDAGINEDEFYLELMAPQADDDDRADGCEGAAVGVVAAEGRATEMAAPGSRTHFELDVQASFGDVETEDNRVVFDVLRDACKVINRQHYPLLREWLDTLTRARPGGTTDAKIAATVVENARERRRKALLVDAGKLCLDLTVCWDKCRRLEVVVHELGLGASPTVIFHSTSMLPKPQTPLLPKPRPPIVPASSTAKKPPAGSFKRRMKRTNMHLDQNLRPLEKTYFRFVHGGRNGDG